MAQKRYSIPINNKPFEFDWAGDSEPTDAEIIDLYKKSLVSKPAVPEPIAAPKITTPITNKNKPLLDVGYEGINSPLVKSNVGHAVSNSITIPRNDQNYLDPNSFLGYLESTGRGMQNTFRGFLGGSLEGVDDVVSNLSTPVDLAATVAGFSPFKKAGNLITGLRGLYNTGSGIMDGDTGQLGAGAFETLMSALGIKAGMAPRKQPIKSTSLMDDAVLPRQVDVAPPDLPAFNKPAVSMPNVKVNPVEGFLSTKDRAVRTPSLANEMYGIRDTGSDGFGSVPARMKTGTNQIVMDALLPSSIKDKIKQAVPLTEPANPNIDDNTIPEVIKNIIKDEASPKPIKDAAQQVVNLRSQDDSIKKGLEPYIKSGLSSLESDSEAGRNIARLIQQTRIEGDRLAGGWSSQFKSIIKDLSDDEFKNLQRAAEGKELPFSSKVKDALNLYRKLDNEVTTSAKDAGMVMEDYSGNVLPFEATENYWPRIYDDDFVKSKQEDIYASLIAEGNSPLQAREILEASTKFGNRLISPQHKRQANIEGYRTDSDAYLLHLDQMGKRIAESKNFGPRDIGDAESPLSKLLAQTKDQKYNREILDRHLGRVKPDASNERLNEWANKANSLAAITDLGLFTISNQAQKAPIAIRGDLKAFGKALTQFKTKAGKDWAEQSGALQTALRDSIQDLGGEHWVNKLYRTGASERSNRTLASLTGKFTAEGDFVRARKGNAQAKDRLKDLLLVDDKGLDNVLKQEFLNEEQLYTAGSRMSELTQGRAGSIDLPPKWRSSPEAKLMTMYKGYAFRQTKAMKDAFLDNPKKFLVVGLPLLAVTGEVVGDAKAAVRGMLDPSSDIEDNISSRGQKNLVDNILKSANTPEKERQLASRVIENLSEAWTLGILSDMIGSSGENPTGLLKFLAGPVPSMAADMAYGGAKSVKDLDIKPVASHAVKNFVPTPFGYPASKMVAGDNKGKKKSSMMPRLPSVSLK